jgi:predicted RNA-binding Zn-ribbon protein involved in translation (DUF1610 family)
LIARQRGRFWLLGIVLGLAGCLMFAPAWVERVTRLSPDAIALRAMLLGFVAFIGAVLLLRCPSCGHSLFWHAVSTQPMGQWLNWLLDVQTCPVCGYATPEPPNKSVPTP